MTVRTAPLPVPRLRPETRRVCQASASLRHVDDVGVTTETTLVGHVFPGELLHSGPIVGPTDEMEGDVLHPVIRLGPIEGQGILERRQMAVATGGDDAPRVPGMGGVLPRSIREFDFVARHAEPRSRRGEHDVVRHQEQRSRHHGTHDECSQREQSSQATAGEEHRNPSRSIEITGPTTLRQAKVAVLRTPVYPFRRRSILLGE